jgi:hypothetical protein
MARSLDLVVSGREDFTFEEAGGVTVSLRSPRLARVGRYSGQHRSAGAMADETVKRVTISTTITTTPKPEVP